MSIRDFSNRPCATCGKDTTHIKITCQVCGNDNKRSFTPVPIPEYMRLKDLARKW